MLRWIITKLHIFELSVNYSEKNHPVYCQLAKSSIDLVTKQKVCTYVHFKEKSATFSFNWKRKHEDNFIQEQNNAIV